MIYEKQHQILVTGGDGLVGNAMKIYLPNARYPKKQELNLLDKNNIDQYIKKNNINTVIHLAAKVGGVGANIKYVADFYSQNIIMNTNLIDSCINNNVSSLVCCLSTCIYPDEKYVSYPLTEEQLHNGPPHQSNFGYAYAKRMVDVQLRSIRQQHGLNYISVIPNNLYGEHDNYDLENGHVIPSLIRKIWEAKINNKEHFEVWGDGQIYREFTYSSDLARCIIFCLNNYNDSYPINIGNTNEYLLSDVISIIKNNLQYDGEIVYDISKPKGQIRKPTSNINFINLGWNVKDYTSLESGLNNTCNWFKLNYPNVRGIN